MPERYRELAHALRRRRAEINIAWSNRSKFGRDKDLTDSQMRVLLDVERGRRDNYEQSTYDLIDLAYELVPGGAQRFLAGGPLVGLDTVRPASQDRAVRKYVSRRAPKSDLAIEKMAEALNRFEHSFGGFLDDMREAVDTIREEQGRDDDIDPGDYIA